MHVSQLELSDKRFNEESFNVLLILFHPVIGIVFVDKKYFHPKYFHGFFFSHTGEKLNKNTEAVKYNTG